MSTFIISKYNKPDETKTSETQNDQVNTDGKNDKEELIIQVSGTISEIVARALNKALGNSIDIEVKQEESNSNIKAISTEDINKTPASTFNSIKKDDILFIHSKGFNTATEEWFLSNLANKTPKVFYTLEHFVSYVKTSLNV